MSGIRVTIIGKDCFTYNGLCKILESYNDLFEVSIRQYHNNIISEINEGLVVFDLIYNINNLENLLVKTYKPIKKITILPEPDETAGDFLLGNEMGFLYRQMEENQVRDELIKYYNNKRYEGRISPLTLSEFKVYVLAKKGLRNDKIADKLNISKKTVENHLYNLKRKTKEY